MNLFVECPKCAAAWCLIETQVQMCQSCLYNANPMPINDFIITEIVAETANILPIKAA